MATARQCRDHLVDYPIPELAGKSIPADLVAAYLFLEHDHHWSESRCPNGNEPYVDSMALYDFLLKYAKEA